MSDRINPFLPEDFPKRLDHCLPDNHPYHDKGELTLIQRFALPILLWFFDKNRGIGQGRSYLYAYILITIAKSNRMPYKISDLSIINTNHQTDRMFVDVVERVMNRHFPKLKYSINISKMELLITGEEYR